MKKNLLKIGTSVFLSSALIFSACQETETIVDNVSYTSTVDNADADRKFNEIHRIVEKNVKENEVSSVAGRFATTTCGSVSLDADNKKITVDFGTEECKGTYGNTHKGKIIITYTGRYSDSNTVITTTLEDYYLNGDKIEGTRTVTNKGKVEGKQTFEINVTNGKITYENGKVATWSSSRTRVIADERTIIPFDEVVNIYGTAEGVNTDGLAYTVNVAESTPIVVDMKCWLEGTRLPKSGIMSISPSGLEIRSINYGDGTCDNAVTVAIGSLSKELSL